VKGEVASGKKCFLPALVTPDRISRLRSPNHIEVWTAEDGCNPDARRTHRCFRNLRA